MPTLEQDKRAAVETALDDGIVMLHIDARRDGVDVPGHLLGDPQLLLSVAYGFRLPALDVDDDGIYAVLRFGSQDFGCTIPWNALYAITQPEFEGRGVLWPPSIPPEALLAAPQLQGLQRVTIGAPADAEDGSTPPVRMLAAGAEGHATTGACDGADAAVDEGVDGSGAEAGSGSARTQARGHLRLVKG